MASAGDMGRWDEKDLEVCNKATSGGSLMLPGIVNKLTESTGQWAAATAGDFGRFGVIPDEEPYNADADPTFSNLTGFGAEIYVTFSNANTVKPGQRVVADTGGKVKGYTESTITATPTQADVLKALREIMLMVGTYRGKDETEGQGLNNPPTDITNAVGRIRLGRF